MFYGLKGGEFLLQYIMQIILDGLKYSLKCMALFWCPLGRASRIEYVYSHRAPGVCGFYCYYHYAVLATP